MTIFLHIGLGKTGTTSIQNFLYDNRDLLQSEHGIVAPKCLSRMNHRRLTMYALNDNEVGALRQVKGITTPERVHAFRKRLNRDFREEILSWADSDTIVMTSEQMATLKTQEEVQRLHDLVAQANHEMKIIVYFRRQDLHYTSAHSQHMKSGKVWFFEERGLRDYNHTYDFETFLARWDAVFGRANIIVRAFEKSSLKNGDVVDDFMAIVGVEDLSAYPRKPTFNTSLDPQSMEFLRLVNPYIPRFDAAGKSRLVRNRFVSTVEALAGPGRISLSKKNAEDYLKIFESINASVARKYMGRPNGDMFKEPIPESEGVSPSITEDEMRKKIIQILDHEVLNQLDKPQMAELFGEIWEKYCQLKGIK